MTQHIKHSLALASTLATLLPGCLLKIDGLDSGMDRTEMDDSTGEDDNLADSSECLIGTEPDAVGVAQSSWDPPCEVVCEEGWGHDGPQLPIAWTVDLAEPDANVTFQGRAIGLLDNGHIVVALKLHDGVALRFFEPDGQGYGGYDVLDVGSHVDGLGIHEGVLYVTYREGDDIMLSAIGIASQQELWARPFAGIAGLRAVGGTSTIALLLASETDPQRELVVLDHDGEILWSQPTVDHAFWTAFSPSGARVVAAGDLGARVYETATGALLDEIVREPGLSAMAVSFVGEDRLVTVGRLHPQSPLTLEGWLAGDSLTGEGDWQQFYNRASAWCPDSESDWPTAEGFAAVAPLADGSVLAVGYESPKMVDGFGQQPWVVRFTPEGEFLAGDRGLWTGHAIDMVAGPDGSAFVLSEATLVPGEDRGFRLRKYVP